MLQPAKWPPDISACTAFAVDMTTTMHGMCDSKQLCSCDGTTASGPNQKAHAVDEQILRCHTYSSFSNTDCQQHCYWNVCFMLTQTLLAPDGFLVLMKTATAVMKTSSISSAVITYVKALVPASITMIYQSLILHFGQMLMVEQY